jgi:isocitrate dehydrogenase
LNNIKLPNFSASIPQLVAAIAELQSQGYNIPNFNASPTTDEEKEIAARYAKVLGSAVNPVLREGNSDRRAAPPVKKYAQKNPHKMGAWVKTSRSHVAHMTEGDFYGSEKSYIMPEAGHVKITLKGSDGSELVLKPTLYLLKDEVIDATRLSKKALCAFFEKEISDCFEKKLMVSLHMKATMMKVSDPIIFGHCIKVYFKDVFEKHAALFKELGINANDGLGSVYDKVKGHAKEEEVKTDIAATYEKRPGLAMVDSGKGITNLHVPSDVIIDASMPVVVRDSGKMWNLDDALEDVKCMIPDRCYARMYKTVLDDCRANGQFDVSTTGHVSNVGLMAQKAEEYGSHDKTFEIPKDGVVQVTDQTGNIIFEHAVETGDLWRMCQTKDEPIKDWVKLAVPLAKIWLLRLLLWLG